MGQHTSRQYEQELLELRERIITMGATVESMVTQTSEMLEQGNFSKIDEVMQKDPAVNQMELDIDALCVRLLALRQPAASDLRLITMGLKLTKELERIGDIAVNIVKRGKACNWTPGKSIWTELHPLIQQSLHMVHGSLDALSKNNVDEAQQIRSEDDLADDAEKQIIRQLVDLLQNHSMPPDHATSLLTIAKYYERLADHSTNIAEMVIFMITGKDVRHRRVGATAS